MGGVSELDVASPTAEGFRSTRLHASWAPDWCRRRARAAGARGGYAAPLYLASDVLRERFQAEGLLEETAFPKPLKIAFEPRPRAGFLSVHRAHPLPNVLAETFLENALDNAVKQDDPATLPRCGVWECEVVDTVVTLLLMRIRHRIDSRGRLGPQFAMAEAAAAIGLTLQPPLPGFLPGMPHLPCWKRRAAMSRIGSATRSWPR